MTNLQTNIMQTLESGQAMTAAHIAEAIPAHREHVQKALHQLDDDGAVILRNGWYRASAVALTNREARNDRG